MKTLTITLLLLLLVTPVAMTQDTKPAEIKLDDFPELSKLRIQNVILQMNTVQSTIAAAQATISASQAQYQTLSSKTLPESIETAKRDNKWEGYDFDYNTLSLKLKPKAPVESK